MSIRLEDLVPDVMFKAMAGIAVLKQYSIHHAVTSTLRTTDEQVALEAQGRDALEMVNALRAKAHMKPITAEENKYTVTNCDGIRRRSPHQDGMAIDIVPLSPFGTPEWPPADDPRWQKIAGVMKEQGFEWGGDWLRFPDPPHYQITDATRDFKRAQDIA